MIKDHGAQGTQDSLNKRVAVSLRKIQPFG